MRRKIKIIVTGGGTGGHVLPLMAVVKELKKETAHIFYIGSGKEIEKEAAKKERLQYRGILSGKMRRYFSLWNIVDFFKVIIGFIQSFFIILFDRPDVIFSKGGYVGLPVIYAGSIFGIPIVIHETDAVMGLANKMTEKRAQKILTGYPIKYYKNIDFKKTIYTGNPIREEFKNLKEKKIFDNKKQTILVTGGSQGARFINQIIAAIVPQLTEKYNVIHVAGKNDYEWLKKNSWPDYRLFDFTDQLPELMKSSDLIITRAGGTLTEIAYLHKPAIIIPLPSAANDHQLINAQIYTKANAAMMLKEDKLDPNGLLTVINTIMKNKELTKLMSLSTRNLSNPQAANTIAKEILSVVR